MIFFWHSKILQCLQRVQFATDWILKNLRVPLFKLFRTHYEIICFVHNSIILFSTIGIFDSRSEVKRYIRTFDVLSKLYYLSFITEEAEVRNILETALLSLRYSADIRLSLLCIFQRRSFNNQFLFYFSVKLPCNQVKAVKMNV